MFEIMVVVFFLLLGIIAGSLWDIANTLEEVAKALKGGE